MMDTCADYLVLPAAFSLISGHYCFTNLMIDYSKGTPNPNGPILTECNTLKTVVSSSDEAEIGSTFENAQNLIPLRHILETVCLHQQPTKGSPIITYNLKYQGVLKCFIKPR